MSSLRSSEFYAGLSTISRLQPMRATAVRLRIMSKSLTSSLRPPEFAALELFACINAR